MKCISRQTLISLLAIVTCTTPILGFSQNFDCNGAQRLVALIAEGPEEVVAELEIDPEDFAFDSMAGWRCGVNPFPPFRNNVPFVSSLECIWDDPLEKPSEEDFIKAGGKFKKNLSSLLECFPDSRAEFPISYQRTTRGEGMKIILDETAVNPASEKQHNLYLSYTYVQDKKTPLFWITEVGYGDEKVASFNEQDSDFCPDLNEIIDDAEYGFDDLKEDYNSRFQIYSSSLVLGDAQRCEVRRSRGSEHFSCRWATYGDESIIDKVEVKIATAITLCLGNKITKSRRSDGRLFLTIGDEAKITLGSRSRMGDRGREHILTLRVREPR